VFPGDEKTSAALGLAELDSTLSAYDKNVIALQDEATNEVSKFNACLEPEVVADILRQAIRDVDIDGWTVEIVGPYMDGQPCGSIEFLLDERVAKVRPLPDIFAS